MKNTFQDESEDLKAFPRHLRIPAPSAPEKDTDDYEDFEDDADMMTELWHKGELEFEDELMRAEDY